MHASTAEQIYSCGLGVALILLPILGGAASVWTTCLLFFQIMLLIGYVYTHLLGKLRNVRNQILIHGVLMDMLGLGVLILGESGIGKSECALDLVVRGHRLVADDTVEVRRRGETEVIGACPELTRYHMEVRGIGVLNIRDLFGVAATRTSKRVELVVQLERWDAHREHEDRLGLDEAHLPRWEAQGRVAALLGDELDARAGGAGELRAAARLHLDVVHGRADGDVAQRERVARTDVDALTGTERVADGEALRREDVALLAVRVVEEGDPGAAVRVVFDVGDPRGDAVLLPAEVDDAEPALVPAALVARRDAAVGVAPGALAALLDERALRTRARDLLEGGDARPPATRARGLVLADGHGYFPLSKISMESPSARVTMARFWAGRRPDVSPRRLTLP